MEYVIMGMGLVILIMAIFIRNLLKQTEQLDDIISTNKNTTIVKLSETLKNMRKIDERGVFEKDDEVGSAFSDINNLIKYLVESL